MWELGCASGPEADTECWDAQQRDVSQRHTNSAFTRVPACISAFRTAEVTLSS